MRKRHKEEGEGWLGATGQYTELRPGGEGWPGGFGGESFIGQGRVGSVKWQVRSPEEACSLEA